MKGYKQCPECTKDVPCAIMECECGYKFVVGETSGKKAKTWDEPGRGRKQCPECEKYVGARSTTCSNCELDFTKVPKTVSSNNDSPVAEYECEGRRSAQMFHWNGPVLIVAAGPAPVKLQNSTYEEVEQWVERVLDHGHAHGVHYAPVALKVWARSQLGLTEASVEAVEHISTVFDSMDFSDAEFEEV